MKSKPKSTTRKKNYKRKNNTRKFRQTAGIGKIDGSSYPVGRYVYYKEEKGFGEKGFKEKRIPAVVDEIVINKKDIKNYIMVHRLSIGKDGKVKKDASGKIKKAFPGVKPSMPIKIDNTLQVDGMTAKEMDELGILDLLSDFELQDNKAYDYFKKKLEEDMKKTSDKSEQAFKNVTSSLVDIDNQQKAIQRRRKEKGTYIDPMGRSRPLPSKNKLSTSSSQGKIETEKKEIARPNSAPNISSSEIEHDTSKLNLNKTEKIIGKITELIKTQKNDPNLEQKLIILLEKLNEAEKYNIDIDIDIDNIDIDNIDDIEEQLNQALALVIYEEKKPKPKSFLLGGPSALDQIQAANKATESAVTGDGAREAAKEVTEEATEEVSLDKKLLLGNVKKVAPHAEPPVKQDINGNPIFSISEKQPSKTRSNNLSQVVPVTGPVPVPPPEPVMRGRVPVPPDDKPGEPAAVSELENEGDMVEPETSRQSELRKSRERLLKTKERKDREEAIKKRQAESKKEYEANLAKMRKEHEELMNQALEKFKERDLEAIKSKPDRPRFMTMLLDDMKQEDLENEDKLKEKISPISFNQEYTDMELIEKVKELREVNHNLNMLIEFVKDIPPPTPPTETDGDPVLPPQPPIEEEGSEPEIHNDEFEASPDGSVVDDEASSDGSIGFDHEGAQKILDDTEEESKKTERINKILAGPQMTHGDFEKEMEELEEELNATLTSEEKKAFEEKVARKIEEDKEIEAMEEELELASSDNDSDDDSQSSGPTQQHMNNDDEDIKKEVKLDALKEELKELKEKLNNFNREGQIEKINKDNSLTDDEKNIKTLEIMVEHKTLLMDISKIKSELFELENNTKSEEDTTLKKDEMKVNLESAEYELDEAKSKLRVAKLRWERKQYQIKKIIEQIEEKEKEITNQKQQQADEIIILTLEKELNEFKRDLAQKQGNKEDLKIISSELERITKAINKLKEEAAKTECDKLKQGLKNEDIQVISNKGADWKEVKIPQYSLLEIKEGDKVTDYGIYIDCKVNEFVYYSLKHIHNMEFSDHLKYIHDVPDDYLLLDGVIQKIYNNNNIRLMTKEEKIDKRVLYNDNVKMLYEFLEKKDVKDVQELINGNNYTYARNCNKESPYTEKFDELIEKVKESENLSVDVEKTREYLKNLDPPEELVKQCNYFVTYFDKFFHENLKNNIKRQIKKLRDEITKSITETRSFKTGGLNKKGKVYYKDVYYLKDNNNILDLHIGKMDRKDIYKDVKKTFKISGSDTKPVKQGTQDFFKDGNIEENINTDHDIENLYPNTLLLAGENTNFSVNVIDDIIKFIDDINLNGDIKENMKLIANIQTIKDCMTKVLKIYDKRNCKMLTNDANKKDDQQKEIYYKMKVINVEEKGTLIKFVEDEKTKYGIFLNCDSKASEASIVYIDTENFINPKEALTQQKPPGEPPKPHGRGRKSEDGFGRKFKEREEINYKGVKITDIELIKKEDFDISMLFKQYLNIHALKKEYNKLKENYNQNAINEYVKKLEKVLDRNMNFIELTEEQQKIMTDLKHEEKLNSLGLMPENYGKPKDMKMEDYIQILKDTDDYHDYILNKAEPSIYMYYNNMLVLIANYNKNQDEKIQVSKPPPKTANNNNNNNKEEVKGNNQASTGVGTGTNVASTLSAVLGSFGGGENKTLANIRKYSERLSKPHFIKIKIDIPGRLIAAIEAIKEVNNIDNDYDDVVKYVFTPPDNFPDREYKRVVQELAKILNPGEDEIPFSPIMLPLKPGSSGSIQVSKPPPKTANNNNNNNKEEEVKGFNQASTGVGSGTNVAATCTGVGCFGAFGGGEKKNG